MCMRTDKPLVGHLVGEPIKPCINVLGCATASVINSEGRCRIRAIDAEAHVVAAGYSANQTQSTIDCGSVCHSFFVLSDPVRDRPCPCPEPIE